MTWNEVLGLITEAPEDARFQNVLDCKKLKHLTTKLSNMIPLCTVHLR